MRTKFVAGNWKMNVDRAGAVALASALVERLGGVEGTFLVAPPFVYLEAVAGIVAGTNVSLGAQNVAAAANGAHTGEVSAAMLRDVGVKSVILGHSERRNEFYESNKAVNAKLRAALGEGLGAVLCVGEMRSHRLVGVTEEVCRLQLEGALAGIGAEMMGRIVVAYEPVWAIGSGSTPTPADISAVHSSIRSVLGRLYGDPVAAEARIAYGGSVGAENAREILSADGVDGVLVGGASLSAESFSRICAEAARVG